MFITIQKPTPYINSTARPAPVPYRSEYWDNVVRRGVSASMCRPVIQFSPLYLHEPKTIRSHCRQNLPSTWVSSPSTFCNWSRRATPEIVHGQSFPHLLLAESVSPSQQLQHAEAKTKRFANIQCPRIRESRCPKAMTLTHSECAHLGQVGKIRRIEHIWQNLKLCLLRGGIQKSTQRLSNALCGLV